MNIIDNHFGNRANKIVRSTKWYSSYWQGVQKFWNISTFKLDIINVGSGAAVNAFDYSCIDLKGMNWAVAPQSLIHDYNILKNYFSYLRDKAVVIITICPFSCLFSDYDSKSNFKYYTFLHPATIDGFDDSERTRALLIKSNPFKAMPIKCLKFTLKEFLSKITNRADNNNVSLEESATILFNQWLKQFGILDISAPLSNKHALEQKSRRMTLNDMVSFCKERGLTPIIVVPPMHHSLTDLFTDNFKANYIDAFLEGVDAPVYNCMYQYSTNDNYFKSSLFLNSNGAQYFTKELVEMLMTDGLFSREINK